MNLWMIRIIGFLIGAGLAVICLAAPATADWPFVQPTPLSEIEQRLARDFDDIGHISPDEFEAMRARGERFILFDVRKPSEFAVSRIPGAVQVDPDAGPDVIRDLLMGAEPDTPVIVYCSVGVRSSKLGRRLASRSEGRPVANLRGGVFAWHNGARPLEDASGATELVHPFNAHWGKLLTRPDLAATSPSP